MKEGISRNQKGFSLVELIVVIAIMVVLMGILAPTFSKFIERAKKSTDVQNVDSIVRAVQIYVSDPNVDTPLEDTATIVLNVGSIKPTPSNCTGHAELALEAAKIKQVGLKSSQWGDDITLTFTITDEGIVLVEESGGNLSATLSLLRGKY